MRSLRRGFQKYISYKKDNNDILYYLLAEEVRKELRYHQSKFGDGSPETLEIEVDALQQAAANLDIHDLTAFYKSDKFLENGFTRDGASDVIIKTL